FLRTPPGSGGVTEVVGRPGDAADRERGTRTSDSSAGTRTVCPMISRLRGTVVARSPAGVVLDVGGVGYLVAATPRVPARIGEGTPVEPYLPVREDALQLYGFASADGRELFELLLGVSGIGPKVALAIVSGSPPAELRKAIARDDLARFEAIPGIGRKT